MKKLQGILIGKEGNELLERIYIKLLKIMEKNYKDISIELKKIPKPLEITDNIYKIEFTSVGLMTLAINNNEEKYYLHSNNNPSVEAFILANSWYREDKTEYVIYGLRLGYHIVELFSLDRSITIEIYESDLRIIQLMCTYSNITNIINQNNIMLVYDPEFKKLTDKLKNLTNYSEFVIHNPSIRNIKNATIKEKN